MRPGVTVVMPTIPPRAAMRDRALQSVRGQTRLPEAVVVEVDDAREGAAATRQRGLEAVETEWVAFLDDDDEFLPHHLESLHAAATALRADYAYSWYEVVGGIDPMPQFFGVPWDDAAPHQTTITTLVRTELALAVGFGGEPMEDPNGGGVTVGGEDYRFTLGCLAAGAVIYHLPARTWRWHHHGRNTSGLASRWKG